MNFSGWTITFIIGLLMVLVGGITLGVMYFRYRRRRKTGESGGPTGGVFVGSALFHIGMLLVTIAGVGLIIYSYYR